VASLSQGRTAAAQCGLFTYKSVPVIFEPPCTISYIFMFYQFKYSLTLSIWRRAKCVTLNKMETEGSYKYPAGPAYLRNASHAKCLHIIF